MNRKLIPLVVPAMLMTAMTLPVRAESLASSVASNSVSASVGSSSTSIEKSSDSSTQGTNVAEGDYTVVELTAAPARPGMVRVMLRAAAAGTVDSDYFLYMPQPTAEQLAKGQTVSVRQRPYGLEFARSGRGDAFFLVLADEWFREMQNNVVTL